MTNKTMTSLEFLNTIINPARIKAGENEIRNRDFIKRVMDECELERGRAKLSLVNGNEVLTFDLDHDQMLLVGMRESKSVRKVVLARLRELEDIAKRPMTTIELLEQATAEMKAKVQESQDKSVATMTVTEIAQRIKTKPNLVNNLLIERGLQTRTIKGGKISYHLTPSGFPHGIESTGKGSATTQLRWRETVISLII